MPVPNPKTQTYHVVEFVASGDIAYFEQKCNEVAARGFRLFQIIGFNSKLVAIFAKD